MLGVIRGCSGGPVDGGLFAGAFLLDALDPRFELSDRRKVLVDLASIGRPKRRFKLTGFGDRAVENALAIAGPPGGHVRSQSAVCAIQAEQAIEHLPRIGHRRQRGLWAAPTDAAGVGAAVFRIAQADYAIVFQA